MSEFQITRADWTAEGLPDNLTLSDTGVISGILDEQYTGIYSAVEAAVTTNYGSASGIIHIFGTDEVLWIDDQEIVLYGDVALESNSLYASGGYIHVNKTLPVITSLQKHTVVAGTVFKYLITTLIYDPDETYSLFKPEADEGSTVAVVYYSDNTVCSTAVLNKETGAVTIRLPDLYETKSAYFDVYVTNEYGTSTKRVILTVFPNLQAPELSPLFPGFIYIGSTVKHQFKVWNPLPGSTFSVSATDSHAPDISGFGLDEETGMVVWHVPDTGLANLSTRYAQFTVQVVDRNGYSVSVRYTSRFLIPDHYKPIIDDNQEFMFDSDLVIPAYYITGHAIHVHTLDLSMVITSPRHMYVLAGQRLEYQITTAGEVPNCSYSVSASSSTVIGMAVDSETGLVTWDVPSDLSATSTSFNMTVKVTNEAGWSWSQIVTVNVFRVDRLRDSVELSACFPAYAVIGSTLVYPMPALNPDPRDVYSITSSTLGLSIDSETGVVTWEVPDTGLTTFVGASATFSLRLARNGVGEAKNSYTSRFIIPDRYKPAIDPDQVFVLDSGNPIPAFNILGQNIHVASLKPLTRISSPAYAYAVVGQRFEYQVTTVGNLQGCTYEVTASSSYDVQVDSETGLVTWDVPSNLSASNYTTITVKARDTEDYLSSLPVRITYVTTKDIMDQVELSACFPAYAVIGSTLTYPLSMLKTDPSNTIAITASTPGLTIDNENNLLVWNVPDTGLTTFVNASAMFSLTATNSRNEQATQSYTSRFIIPDRYKPVIDPDQVFVAVAGVSSTPWLLAGSNIHTVDQQYSLWITSPRMVYAIKGTRVEYQVTLVGSVPNASYSINSITVAEAEVEIDSETGLVTWDVPADFRQNSCNVSIIVRDNDSQLSCSHTITIKIFPDATQG